MNVCPLVFEPIFREKVWGGRNLERVAAKVLPAGLTIGESWECVDLENACSVVARGPAKGRTLRELIEEWGEKLLGRAPLFEGRFPLLIKFLDAVQDLSIQVHPHEAWAKKMGGNVRVKHEAWHILSAEPGACIYRGMKPGVSMDDLRIAMSSRPAAIIDYLQRMPVKAGQTYYLPSGTPHALGGGTVVAEVQTPSDITYRLYDWDRVRPGADAGLHIEEGLACILPEIDFARFEKKSHVTSLFTTVSRLVACPNFVIEKVRFIGELEQEIPYAEMVCWIVLEGEGAVLFQKNERVEFGKGDVVILPAGLENGRVMTKTDCAWLEVTIPVESDLAAFGKPDASELRSPSDPGIKPIQIGLPSRKRESQT